MCAGVPTACAYGGGSARARGALSARSARQTALARPDARRENPAMCQPHRAREPTA